MNTEKVFFFAKSWGIFLPIDPTWIDYVSLIQVICNQKNGYFIFKIDGERDARKFTHTLNLPHPVDVVIRKDSDDMSDGIKHILNELCRLDVKP
jgi:hypothetical protein